MHDLRLARLTLSLTLAAAAVTAAPAARADAPWIAAGPDAPAPPPRVRRATVSVFASTGYLASPGANGGALDLGLRALVARHVALSADAGYGVLSVASAAAVQDRWWLVPAVGYVVPAGRARFELGGGVGLGASSGYASWTAYGKAPFTPVWAYQLMPTARLHGVASWSVAPRLDVFARVDAARLLRSGSDARWTDTSWALLSVGVAAGVL
ncbi:MAG TPA: hypothetical protein VHB21_12955 [Minicystis sp.]|nr:hypothetical protein [Minicystis sp.]